MFTLLPLTCVIFSSDFLQIIAHPARGGIEDTLEYDVEWLAIVKNTYSLLHTSKSTVHVPTVINPPSAEVRLCQPTNYFVSLIEATIPLLGS